MEDINDDELQNYPLLGSKHLNLIGVNLDPVRMFTRTQNDFETVNKLTDPHKPLPKTKTNYEAYLTPKITMRTKGMFMNDPQRIAVTRHAAGF